jgi:hypothetical protein
MDHSTTPMHVIPAEQAGLCPASESRNPVNYAVSAVTPAIDYWIPARASPLMTGSLGRDDNHMQLLCSDAGCLIINAAARVLWLVPDCNNSGDLRNHPSGTERRVLTEPAPH